LRVYCKNGFFINDIIYDKIDLIFELQFIYSYILFNLAFVCVVLKKMNKRICVFLCKRLIMNCNIE